MERHRKLFKASICSFLGLKNMKKRIRRNDRKNFPWDFEKRPGSLHFPLLAANLVFQWIFVLNSVKYKFFPAVYKNRNTGTGNGMRGMQEMGECYIPENVTKHSGQCPQTFWRMSSNIPGNVLKHSGECPLTYRGMLPNIPGNVAKYSE